MSDHLAGCWEKWRRAREHLESLEIEVHRAVSDPANQIILRPDFDFKAGCCVIRFHHLPPYPLVRWGVLVGDLVHDLHSALDHLAWRLVQTGTATNLSPKDESRIHFPIHNTRSAFRGDLETGLPGVRCKQRALVYRYQPCKRYHTAQLSPLATLKALSITDKHRVVTPIGFNLENQTMRFEGNEDVVIRGSEMNTYVPFEPDAVVAVLEVSLRGPRPEVYIKDQLASYVVFGEGRVAARVYFGGMLGNVESILEDFEPLFDALGPTRSVPPPAG